MGFLPTKSIYICTYVHGHMDKNLVKIFKALGEETRFRIVQCLIHHDHCACDFARITGKDQTTVSRHLKILVEASILETEKKGRNIIYRISNETVRERLLSFGITSMECCHGGCTYE